jgi:hypothetical protein
MNEDGLVINWMLTRGESLKEGQSILEQAKRQSDGIDMLVTGTTCSDCRKKSQKGQNKNPSFSDYCSTGCPICSITILQLTLL